MWHNFLFVRICNLVTVNDCPEDVTHRTRNQINYINYACRMLYF